MFASSWGYAVPTVTLVKFMDLLCISWHVCLTCKYRIIGSIYPTSLRVVDLNFCSSVLWKKETKASENLVSLQIFVSRQCVHVCMYTHVRWFVCMVNNKSLSLYSWATNKFTLARFYLGFQNILVVNNRWHQVALK